MTDTITLVKGRYSIDPENPQCPVCNNGKLVWNFYARETYVCINCGWEFEKVRE